MFDRLPRLVLVPHADAGDRRVWTTDQDLRPLSELGVSQAAALAKEIGPVDAIVSSPARRCVETVQPIAEVSEVTIELSEDLREVAFVDEVDTWDAWDLEPVWRGHLVAGAAVGRALRVLVTLEGQGPDRRVVLGAHGDLVPILAMVAAGHFRVPAPPPVARGGCYEIVPSDRVRPIVAIGALLGRPV